MQHFKFFSSYKSKRVARSVMGAEDLASPDGSDYTHLWKRNLHRSLGKNDPLALSTDSESLFKTVFELTKITEKG